LSGVTLQFLNASLDLFGWIPHDPRMTQVVVRSQLIVAEAPDAPSAKAFRILTERLIEMSSNRIKMKGNTQFFFRRMLKGDRAGK
jgi:MinD-like ATPase involved in chromosome partitioning or flagellar assembly